MTKVLCQKWPTTSLALARILVSPVTSFNASAPFMCSWSVSEARAPLDVRHLQHDLLYTGATVGHHMNDIAGYTSLVHR